MRSLAPQMLFSSVFSSYPLDGPHVLVVVVSRGNHVTQKVIDAPEDLRANDLVQAANYLNAEFSGRPLTEVRATVLMRLEQERILYDELLACALRLARVSLDTLPEEQMVRVEGLASLVDAEGTDTISPGTLRALLEMVEEKERLVFLLNEYIDGPGLTVVIGGEHRAPRLQTLSLIAVTTVDGTSVRTVGLIGPTRMHYPRAIALIEGTSRAVTRVLRDVH